MGNNYYKLSKELFEKEEYRNLSTNSKVAYAIMCDMLNDKKENTYLIGTREIIQEKLTVSVNTITKIYKELSSANLIDEKKLEKEKGNVVYVMVIGEEDVVEELKEEQTNNQKTEIDKIFEDKSLTGYERMLKLTMSGYDFNLKS